MSATQPEPTARDWEVAAQLSPCVELAPARQCRTALNPMRHLFCAPCKLADAIVHTLATVRAEEREHLATEALAKHERDEVEPMWSEVADFIRRGDAAEPGAGGGRG